jgi:hypothetical protein
MKIRQKISALFVAVIMMFTMGIQAFAATTMDDVMFDLTTLGIMEGNENGDLQLDKELTRAEFACITVRFMNMKDRAENYVGEPSFSDVPKEHWAFGSIEVLRDLNLIDGTGDGKFSPDDNVTAQQAAKILLNALGYSVYAQMSGSYPDGYMSQAVATGLLDNVDLSSQLFTRGMAARMVYNALDIDIVTVKYTGSLPSYETVSGDTYRNKFKGEADGTLVKRTGIVTATADAYLDSPRANMEDNQVEIDNKLYSCSDPNVLSYIGQSVDFYLDEDDDYTIVSIKPNSDNNVTTFSAENIKSLSDTSISYYTDEDASRTKSQRIAAGAALLLNNRIVSNWNTDIFTGAEKGSVELIDNNDDNNIEVIVVKVYTSVMVESVNASSNIIYLQDRYTIGGKKYINMDTEDNDDRRITLKYADGETANIADLEQNDVLSAYVSNDETVIELIAERNAVSGTLSRIDEDSAEINGEVYNLETDDALDNVSINDNITAYLNFNGEIVYARAEEVNGDYAYILKVYMTEDGETYQAKLLVPDVLTEVTEEVEDEDGGESTTKSKLVCKNKQVLEVPLADTISIDGSRAKVKEMYTTLAGRVIEYRLNSDGELSKITTPELIGAGREKYYNSNERTFGKTSGGAFGISLSTKTICIPKDNYNPSNADCLVYVDMNDGQLYDVKGYDKNEDTKTADLIVVTMTMKSGTEGLVTTDSDVAMVQNFREAINEDDEPVYIADLLTQDGNEISYELTEACVSSSDFTIMPKGALIAYSLDNEYKMDKFMILGEMSATLDYGLTNLRKEYETFAGFAADITYDDVSEELNRWVNTLSCTEEEDGTNVVRTYEVLKKNPPPVFLYNSSTEKSEFGTIKDIAIGTDQIFVSAANNEVRAIVVIKN